MGQGDISPDRVPTGSVTVDESDEEDAMSEVLPLPSPLGPLPKRVCTENIESPCTKITESEAQMAVAMTEYFQEQRKVYEQVS